MNVIAMVTFDCNGVCNGFHNECGNVMEMVFYCWDN